MGAACGGKKKVPVLDAMNFNLSSRPTGTLVYHGKEGPPQDKTQSLIFSQDTFFGVDLKWEDMELGEKIGEGSYGEVYKARYTPRCKRVALKKILLSDNEAERQEILEDFEKEVKILQITCHERIVLFLGAISSDPYFCMLFELAAGSVGSLLKQVENKEVQVTWRMAFQIAVDAAEACVYLHQLEPKIIHRDLKAENLLLDEGFRCKLSDFGLSRVYEKNNNHMTICGTPCWVAPEIFRGDPYTERVDVYSFGIVLWELFSFTKPYKDQDAMELPFQVAKKGLRPPMLLHCPPSLNELMTKCWEDRQELRPTMQELLDLLEGPVNEQLGQAGLMSDDAASLALNPKIEWTKHAGKA